MKVSSIRILFVCGLLVAPTGRMQTVAIAQSPDGSKAQSATTGDPLLRLLVSKGLLTTEEAALVLRSGTAAQQRDRLATLLKEKGLISNAEFEAGMIRVEDFHLYSSKLTTAGPLHARELSVSCSRGR